MHVTTELYICHFTIVPPGRVWPILRFRNRRQKLTKRDNKAYKNNIYVINTAFKALELMVGFKNTHSLVNHSYNIRVCAHLGSKTNECKDKEATSCPPRFDSRTTATFYHPLSVFKFSCNQASPITVLSAQIRLVVHTGKYLCQF